MVEAGRRLKQSANFKVMLFIFRKKGKTATHQEIASLTACVRKEV